MKIYFSASRVQRKKYNTTHKQIITFLKTKGHTVFERITSEFLLQAPDIPSHKIKKWYKEWSTYIQQADIAIIEGSHTLPVFIPASN